VIAIIERSVGELQQGDHAAFSFANGEEREQVIGPFLHEGLRTSEKIIYVSDDQPRHLPGMRNRIEAGRLAETGQLRVIPRRLACLTRERFDPDRMLAVIGQEISLTAEQGFRGVRVTSDMNWVLDEPGGYGRLLACETRFEQAITPDAMIMAICQLNRNRCPPDQLSALNNTHEIRVTANPEFDDGVLRITRLHAPAGLRLKGELDTVRHTAIVTALSSITAVNTDIHLDFAQVRFLDLDTLRLLMTHAMHMPASNALVLDNLPPEVDSVIQTLGWHHFPGLSRGQQQPA
jgi:anti-anti-sigma regulatory factor